MDTDSYTVTSEQMSAVFDFEEGQFLKDGNANWRSFFSTSIGRKMCVHGTIYSNRSCKIRVKHTMVCGNRCPAISTLTITRNEIRNDAQQFCFINKRSNHPCTCANVLEQEERDNDIEQNDGNNGAAIEAELGTHNVDLTTEGETVTQDDLMKRMKHIKQGPDAILMRRLLLLRKPFTRAVLPEDPPNFDDYFSDPKILRGYAELDKNWYENETDMLIESDKESEIRENESDLESEDSSMSFADNKIEDTTFTQMATMVDTFFGGGPDSISSQPGASVETSAKAQKRGSSTQETSKQRKYPKRSAAIFKKGTFKY